MLRTGQLRGFGQMNKGKYDSGMTKFEKALAVTGRDPADIIELFDNDEGFVQRAAEYLSRGAVQLPASYQLARRIMGENFFGAEDWTTSYGVSFNNRQWTKIDKFPWSAEVLESDCPFNKGKKIFETHVAFLGLDKFNGQPTEARGPLTMMQWQLIHHASGQPRFYNYGSNCWYPNEEFATKPTCEFRWYLGLKEIVPNSSSTSWDDMQGMITDEYYVPSPVVELTKDFMVYQKTKKYPNRNVYAATDTLRSGGYRVIVGRCRNDGVVVHSWDGNAHDRVGLSLFRK